MIRHKFKKIDDGRWRTVGKLDEDIAISVCKKIKDRYDNAAAKVVGPFNTLYSSYTFYIVRIDFKDVSDEAEFILRECL